MLFLVALLVWQEVVGKIIIARQHYDQILMIWRPYWWSGKYISAVNLMNVFFKEFGMPATIRSYNAIKWTLKSRYIFWSIIKRKYPQHIRKIKHIKSLAGSDGLGLNEVYVGGEEHINRTAACAMSLNRRR